MGANEQNLGSISIPQFIIMNGGIASHTQWITLFEHEDDDEYDGQMGLNDEEEPMILVNLVVSQNAVKKDKPKEDRLSAKASPKQPVFTSPKVTKPSGRISTSANRSSLDLKKEPSQTQSIKKIPTTQVGKTIDLNFDSSRPSPPRQQPSPRTTKP
jgi:hypothetical protein